VVGGGCGGKKTRVRDNAGGGGGGGGVLYSKGYLDRKSKNKMSDKKNVISVALQIPATYLLLPDKKCLIGFLIGDDYLYY